jgi:hypothetical protein
MRFLLGSVAIRSPLLSLGLTDELLTFALVFLYNSSPDDCGYLLLDVEVDLSLAAFIFYVSVSLSIAALSSP